MTVGEMIDKLQTYPEHIRDIEIVVSDSEKFHPVELAEVRDCRNGRLFIISTVQRYGGA